MKTSIYTRHRFHPDIIRRAVWMYFRFNLSFRDIEELLGERGIEVSYETIRRWVDKFGSTYAKRIKLRAERPSPIWHLDEVYTKINGEMVYLWRAVDDEGTVLDVVVQRRRNTKAALCLLQSSTQASEAETSSRHRRSQETTAPNVHMSPSDEENENHKSSGQLGMLKNCSPFTVKSTTTGVTSSQGIPLENFEPKHRTNGIS